MPQGSRLLTFALVPLLAVWLPFVRCCLAEACVTPPPSAAETVATEPAHGCGACLAESAPAEDVPADAPAHDGDCDCAKLVASPQQDREALIKSAGGAWYDLLPTFDHALALPITLDAGGPTLARPPTQNAALAVRAGVSLLSQRCLLIV